jgi:hypothetical protein
MIMVKTNILEIKAKKEENIFSWSVFTGWNGPRPAKYKVEL